MTLATEHESVLSCARVRECTLVGVGHDGRVDPAQVGRAIRPDTELVSLSLANGEVGCVQPVHDVALLVAAERAPAPRGGGGIGPSGCTSTPPRRRLTYPWGSPPWAPTS